MGNQSSRGRIFVEDPIRNHTAALDGHHEDHVRDMGRRRRENDDRADALAEARALAEQGRRAVCLQRWPGLLSAIRRLLAVYNDAAGAELLTATEQFDGEDPAVTIASQGSAYGTITIAVDGDALLVHTNSGSRTAAARHRIARRIDCSRSDASTAAYLLQEWMDQL
jgi:hypothetical protein